MILTGGTGGQQNDGWLTICHAGNGGMLFVDSVEIDELAFPRLVREQRIEADTEGAGRFRGAPSARIEYGPTTGGLDLVYASDGFKFAGAGIAGGPPRGDVATASSPGRDAGGARRSRPGLAGSGETIIVRTATGGGYGPRTERELWRVARDVTEGWVTRERAREVYGVVIDGHGNIDAEATQAPREPAAGRSSPHADFSA